MDQQVAGELSAAGLTAWVEQRELALPWGTGETWKITGGPHHNAGTNVRPWSALDFSPGATGSWKVRSAAGGVVAISASCPNFVLIKHPNGWQTGYYHLTGIPVVNGQSITKGTYLGKTSTAVGCGGTAYGAHVHFSLRKSGVYQEWKNRYIGGFYVRDGSAQYTGCLERVSDRKKFCPGASFGNSGQIGLGKPGTPQPLAPIGGATTNAANFSWQSTYGLVNYRIEVASEPAFAAPLISARPASASYATSSLPNGTYYWRVRAENFSHSGNWSGVQSFILDTSAPPRSPIIVNPVLTPGFGDICKTAWYKVAGAGYNKSNLYLR